MIENGKKFTDNNNQVLEQHISAYYSMYKADPFFKSNLRRHLTSRSMQTLKREIGRDKRRLPVGVFSQPVLKWVGGILLFTLLLFSLFTIHPVRAAIERTLDIGYIDRAGFVKVSETNILNGATYSNQIAQTIGIDQVVVNLKRTQIWFHSTGKKFSPESVDGEYISYLEVNGENYPLNSWSWDDGEQKGVLEFSTSGSPMPMSLILHFAPDWTIPIQLIPMSQSPTIQTVMTFPNLCQNHAGINLCLQAFVTDPAGYHLSLSASSSDPDLYLHTLETTNPLTGEEAVLRDSSGNTLTEIYPSVAFIPVEVPGGNSEQSREVSTTLSFVPVSQRNESLTLLISGLNVKTSINETITCDPGKDMSIGSTFPCEKSINIGGNTLNFHYGEITQGPLGIRLTLDSDPIQSVNGLLLTGVDLDNLNDDPSTLLSSSFDVQTKQLTLWKEVDSAGAEQSFNVLITDGYLTIEEPFQFTWDINP